jgi:hypothetical protein
MNAQNRPIMGMSWVCPSSVFPTQRTGKVPVLFLTQHHTMKTYWGSGCTAPRILNLGNRWRRVVSCTHLPLYPPPTERAPGTHWIGGWMCPRAVLDAVVKRKIPNPRRKSNPRTPIVQPVAQRYTDLAITALHTTYRISIFVLGGGVY